MDEADVAKFAEGWMKKGEEEEEEEVKKEEVEESTESSEVESSLVEIEVEDDLNAISEALELSEENAEKARTIFKAAVQSKVSEIKEQLESQYSEELQTSVEKVKSDLSEAVDKYLSYCAEEWTKENELAIERGLRSEMTENFIEGLKTLFVEHYVDVPEDKYNVIDELANRLEEMESKLDGEISRNMEITEELDTLKRGNIVRQAGEDLTESQKEKLSSLANGVDFKDAEDFAEKISEIKEAYFGVKGDELVEETKVEEGTGSFEEETSEKVLDPTIAKYSQALSKLKPLG
jgi:membrane-associated HD superfamily phosphohydrolase